MNNKAPYMGDTDIFCPKKWQAPSYWERRERRKHSAYNHFFLFPRRPQLIVKQLSSVLFFSNLSLTNFKPASLLCRSFSFSLVQTSISAIPKSSLTSSPRLPDLTCAKNQVPNQPFPKLSFDPISCTPCPNRSKLCDPKFTGWQSCFSATTWESDEIDDSDLGGGITNPVTTTTT